MKIIICTLAMVMLLLGGCQSTVTTVLEMSTAGQETAAAGDEAATTEEATTVLETMEDMDILTKAQEIAILAPDTEETTQTITDREEITAFITSLDLGQWVPAQQASDAKVVGTFVFSQEDSIKMGQSATDGTLHEVCRLVLYEDSQVDLIVGPLSLPSEIPAETAAYLREFF